MKGGKEGVRKGEEGWSKALLRRPWMERELKGSWKGRDMRNWRKGREGDVGRMGEGKERGGGGRIMEKVLVGVDKRPIGRNGRGQDNDERDRKKYKVGEESSY